MERIQISLTGIESERLQLGFEGEQNHTRVVIYCSLIFEKYPDAVATMSIKPPTGDIYPKTLIRDGRKVIWEASAADCAIPGNGQYQLTFTDGDEIIKTYIGEYTVLPSLIGSGDPPDPVEDWLQEAQEALDAFEQDVSDAEAWAVGTREGDPVGSTDPAFHNNSKYYADQAGAIEQTIETTGAAQVSAIEAKGEEVLESIPSDYTALSEDVDQLFTTKADKIGSAPDLIAGTAEQLMSSDTVEDAVPYLYRKSGGGLDIGNRENLEKIVGGTVAWNQILDVIVSGSTVNGLTLAVDNGVITVTGTATADTNFNLDKSLVAYPANHVLVCVGVLGGSGTTYRNVLTGYNQYFDGIIVYKPTTAKKEHFRLFVNNGYTANLKFSPQIFDLTAMFGSTIADYIYALEQATPGAGVAWFRKLFPADYYDYNAGELISVSGLQSHDMVGFNQWDEEWESGFFNTNTGEKINSATRLRCKNPIKVFPSTNYYIKNASGTNIYCFAYDAEMNLIDYWIRANSQLVTPANCHYLNIATYDDYGTVYKNDICINISSSRRNGEYEPYVKHSYPLDSSLTLRGIPKLDSENKLYYDGDEYLPDGNVKRRYGVVDLGTITWAYLNIEGHRRFIADFVAKNNTLNLICPRYEAVGYTAVFNNTKVGIAVHSDGTQLVVYDPSFNDAATFKTAMSGVYLVYELATPTTEQADPYAHVQVVDPYGTEEFVSTSIVPVGHSTKYPADLVKKLEGLPWNFSSLIAPTETSTTASRVYAVGNYLIYQNTLYKVTSAIASGGTITPGTNVTATTIMAELIALA